MPAGRRSGKTELAKRKLIGELIAHDARNDGTRPRYFAAAPTRDQGKEIWWECLKALTPPQIIAKISETALSITTRRGAYLRVVGLDKPQRIEGTGWNGCVIDELADCKPGIFDAHVFPMLADRNGWCWLIGVPDADAPGQVEYANRVKMAKLPGNPDWECFSWPMSDIQSASQIDAMRRTMDPDKFRQEVLGDFVLTGGLAFPTFTDAHVSDPAYDPALPLCWALDFNINPMCSGLIQHAAGQVRVLHEFVLPDSDTNVACDAFLEYCEREGISPRGVNVYGDPSGNARDSTSGKSDWAIVRQRLNDISPVMKVPRAHSPLKDTKNALQARIKNAAGQSNLVVHRSCRQLIKEFGELLWPSDLSEGHCVAWLRYFCHREFPIQQFVFPTANQFSV